MKSVSFFCSRGLGVCLLLLAGCASSAPSRYYVLSPLTGEGKVNRKRPVSASA